MELRILGARDIDRALPMIEAVDANARAYQWVASGEAVMPRRLTVETPDGVVLLMPAYMKPTGGLAMKAVSVFGGNPGRGLPTIHALVMVFEGDTGRPRAVLDGTRLTALRTGAGAGAATDRLARKDSRVLALFGAGGQAMDQAEAVLAVRDIEEVRIYTPSGVSADKLAAALRDRRPGLKAEKAGSPQDAVRGADVVSCATTSRSPVFDPADVPPGCHINGVGSFRPEMKEVPVAGLPDVRVFVDQIEAAMAEAGELIEAVDAGLMRWEDLVEIGRVISGDVPGRATDHEITFFKSVGLAAQDAVTAGAVLEKAEAQGIGTVVEL